MKARIVIVETLNPPRTTSMRIARAFSRPDDADVILCHWHRLDFSATAVTVRGQVYRVTSATDPCPVRVDSAQPIDAIFFYGPNSGRLTERDTGALQRLVAQGIEVNGLPIYKVVDRMLLAASRRGVITNALGSSRSWGPKHQQEARLRSYESATGRVILRPRTHIARPAELSAVLRAFAARDETCLIKPTFGEGGRGFVVLRPGDCLPQCKGIVVVQQLMSAPLLLHGHKADIRFFLLLDIGNDHRSGRVGPILIRRAAVPYVAESPAAEITNTAFRLRHGYPPDISPLQCVSGVSLNLRAWIVSAVDSLARDLVNAYFWYAKQELAQGADSYPRNRVILFGIDALVVNSATQPRLYFLEFNPFPGFFRDQCESDAAVDAMLSNEYRPFLVRSGRE